MALDAVHLDCRTWSSKSASSRSKSNATTWECCGPDFSFRFVQHVKP